MPTYQIVNNHALNQCHPETCCCDEWALIRWNNSYDRDVIERSDSKEYLERQMKKLNEQKHGV